MWQDLQEGEYRNEALCDAAVKQILRNVDKDDVRRDRFKRQPERTTASSKAFHN
jgi:hypothetical protein